LNRAPTPTDAAEPARIRKTTYETPAWLTLGMMIDGASRAIMSPDDRILG